MRDRGRPCRTCWHPARHFRQEGIERFQDLTKSLTSHLVVVHDSVAPISTPNGRQSCKAHSFEIPSSMRKVESWHVGLHQCGCTSSFKRSELELLTVSRGSHQPIGPSPQSWNELCLPIQFSPKRWYNVGVTLAIL